MILLKDYMPALLPDYVRDQDSYKDLNNKGFIVRFLEIFGEELDDEFYSKIEGWLINISPITSDAIYLDYFAVMLGDIEKVSSNTQRYRGFLSYIASIYKIKGTKKSYVAILRSIGLETVVNELVPDGNNYDDPLVEYDDPGIAYDVDNAPCSDYTLTITGPTITGEIYRLIDLLVNLVEPINARRTGIIYNTVPITAVYIEVYVDEFGDLIYDNVSDPGLVLTLVNGDLIISGPNASLYYLGNDGDLYYIL
jgi:hypothetical protein